MEQYAITVRILHEQKVFLRETWQLKDVVRPSSPFAQLEHSIMEIPMPTLMEDLKLANPILARAHVMGKKQDFHILGNSEWDADRQPIV